MRADAEAAAGPDGAPGAGGSGEGAPASGRGRARTVGGALCVGAGCFLAGTLVTLLVLACGVLWGVSPETVGFGACTEGAVGVGAVCLRAAPIDRTGCWPWGHPASDAAQRRAEAFCARVASATPAGAPRACERPVPLSGPARLVSTAQSAIKGRWCPRVARPSVAPAPPPVRRE
ncbi:membrane protein UL45 [Beluga whale alphaherpesvirus 1]|uniref:Membrane protein UL45 n=1 Tax=Beluga whale alphaherpesvirus 1 TaxID=1434720 RepID=A0A286MMA3_9ALPH|nr:membrane protein UL45 [Beluga whale alphaherpesvirus 1]ASW27129.1 membrane protein UL45 [Beluga whale alphaherpesvirus 1]